MVDDKHTNFVLEKKNLIDKNKAQSYQGLQFNQDEEAANQIFQQLLLNHRQSHDNQWFQTFTLRNLKEIEQDDIFKILSIMPKGAVHHLHGDCAVDIDWFLSELAFLDTSYFSQEKQSFKHYSNPSKVEQGYVLISKLRDQAANKEEFLEHLRSRIQFSTDTIREKKQNIWIEFETRIMGMTSFLYHKDIYPLYLKQVFLNFCREGFIRVEARMFLGWIHDDEGKAISIEEYYSLVQSCLKDVRQQYPEFSFGIIIQGLKLWDHSDIENCLKQTFEAKVKYPDFILGFDMVQEEDKWKSMTEIAKTLLKREQLEQQYNIKMPYILHGGESTNYLFNSNMADNILMDSVRIGHGIGLMHHSYLLETVKNKGICIECCPISNQTLEYITDIRLHPIRLFFNYGIKVSISPDDPSLWGLKAGVHDFFFAAVGSQFDLKEFKVIVKNSIDCSVQSQENKNKEWQSTLKQWDQFIQKVLSTYQKK